MYLAAVSLRTSHFLSFIDIYGASLSECEDVDGSLSGAALGLFAAVRYKQQCICHPLPNIAVATVHLFVFHFLYNKAEILPTFTVAGAGYIGI